MAETPIATTDSQSRPEPRSVLAAKPVDVLLVTYTDDSGTSYTQLAVAGDNEVHLLEGRAAGFSRYATPQGRANEWLAEAIFKKLGRTRKKQKKG